MRRFSVLSLNVLLIGVVSSQQMLAQVKTQTPQRLPDDVVRVNTALIQTDVTVLDKRGRFVDGLSANDFELRVDSKLQSLSFFEEVAAGSVDEVQCRERPPNTLMLHSRPLCHNSFRAKQDDT